MRERRERREKPEKRDTAAEEATVRAVLRAAREATLARTGTLAGELDDDRHRVGRGEPGRRA